MKKIITLILLVVLVAGCSGDYKDTVSKNPEGVEFKIDSVKWSPALVQVSEDKVVIYESKEIHTVHVYNPVSCFFLGLLFGALIVLIICICNIND